MTISLGRTLVTALVAIAGAALAFAVQATPAGAQTCSDYTCADYLEHDLDNYTRARGRQITETTSPDYHSAFMSACADSSTGALGGQLSDIDEGRVYGGVGQATCWWSV